MKQGLNQGKKWSIPEPPDVSNHKNLNLLDHDLCGPITEQKIFGGNKTGVSEFPWMALLGYEKDGQYFGFQCAGTIISKRYILTAAHCVTTLPPSRYILFGRNYIHVYRYPRSNMSYPTKFEKLTFFEKWINNNVVQLILKSCESNCLFNIFK